MAAQSMAVLCNVMAAQSMRTLCMAAQSMGAQSMAAKSMATRCMAALCMATRSMAAQCMEAPSMAAQSVARCMATLGLAVPDDEPRAVFVYPDNIPRLHVKDARSRKAMKHMR